MTHDTADADLLAEMARAVVESVHPEQVLVFGSHARGTATAASDVDLLIVESEPFGPGRSRREELRRIRRALSRFHVPKDVLLYSRPEIERWMTAPKHLRWHFRRWRRRRRLPHCIKWLLLLQ